MANANSDLGNFDDIMREWAEGLIKKIQSNMVDMDINASGETSRSLEYVFTDTGIQILGAEYFAERTEVGRTPTKNKQSFDFQSIIAQWIKDKGLDDEWGLDDERDIRRAAFGIVRNITTLGSSKYRGDRPQTDVYSTAIDDAVDDIEDKLLTGAGERLLGLLDEFMRENGQKVGRTKIK